MIARFSQCYLHSQQSPQKILCIQIKPVLLIQKEKHQSENRKSHFLEPCFLSCLWILHEYLIPARIKSLPMGLFKITETLKEKQGFNITEHLPHNIDNFYLYHNYLNRRNSAIAKKTL